jgi:hypothetical protein
MRFVATIAFAVLLLGVRASGQGAPRSTVPKSAVATNRCYAKGGIGIVNKELYIDLKSSANRLLLEAGKSWTGNGRDVREVVIVFDGRVLSANSKPEGFDLSKSIIVSFEGEEVRFFDFANSLGGYYKREPAN